MFYFWTLPTRSKTFGLGDDITNWGDYVTIDAGAGNDSIQNFLGAYIHIAGINASINGGEGNDSIKNLGDSVTIDGGAENDTISNEASWAVSISAGDGDDSIYNGYHFIWNSKAMQWETTERISDNSTIEGGNGNDTIFNEIGNNVIINGDDGNDEIHSFGLNVTINGSSGDDIIGNGENSAYNIIDGGDGNDSIYSWGSNSTIAGGNGNDFIYNNNIRNAMISGGNEDDSILIDYSGENATITAGTGNDLISLQSSNYNKYTLIKYTLGDGNDTIYGFRTDSTLSISGSSYSTTKSGDDFIVTVGAGKITLVGAASLSAVNIVGVEDSSYDSRLITLTEGNDSYYNTVDGATINALGGDDTILNDGGASVSVNGGAGNDSIYSLLKGTVHSDSCTLIGGDGNDTIWNDGEEVPYGGVEVLIDCGNGDDNVSNDGENSTVLGGAGNDEIYNWSEKSSIDGGDGNDIIYNQNDSTNKTASKVTITGGVGDDSIYNGNWSLGGSSVSIDGGDGNDLIHNGNWNSGVSLNGSDSVTILGGAGNDSIFNYKGIKSFIDCGTGNDSVYIDNDYLTVTGGDGNDTIDGNCAYSSVNGDAGDDKITILNWNNATVNGGKGNDTLYGSNSNNATTNGSGILYQYSNSDGNDIIYGFRANSTLSISGGSYSTTKSDDNIIVTVGEDKISLIGAAILDAVNIDGEEENLTNLTFNNKTDSDVTLPAQTKIVDASERTKPIKITGNTLANSLFGGKSNDTLDGTEGNNTLTGGKGKDIFIHNGGNDIITDYEKGKDKINLDNTSISNFTIINKDVIFALSNNNSLTLNNMADKQISFLSGSKTTKMAFTNNASLDGSEKGATLIAAITEFSAVNYSKLVTINAENVSSAINIIGNNKANRIIAGNHGSTLNGGKGKDSLIGGNGSDIFIYKNKSGNKIIQNYSSSDTVSLVGAQLSDAYTKGKETILKVGSKKIIVKDATNQEITINENGTTKFFIDNILYDEEKTSATLSSKFSTKDEKIFDSTISYINASNAKKKLDILVSATDGATIESGKGKDTLIGGSGNDSISGGKGKDSLVGNAGYDTLWGGKGNDSLWGGDGDDVFIFYAGEGNDVIADYTSGDMLQIMNKKGTGYADFKKATFKNESLTLNINGGGKVILNGVDNNTLVNINGENNKISSLLK